MIEGKKRHDELVEESSSLHDDKTIIQNATPTPTSSNSSSIGEEELMVSDGSSIITSSSDTADEASSPLNLFDLSEIMCQLPIKRGLSKFYDGKSESFTSFSNVKCVENLKKNRIPYERNSKSCGNGLSYCSYKTYTRPKAVISKKTTRRTSFLSSFSSKRQSFTSTKPPMS